MATKGLRKELVDPLKGSQGDFSVIKNLQYSIAGNSVDVTLEVYTDEASYDAVEQSNTITFSNLSPADMPSSLKEDLLDWAYEQVKANETFYSDATEVE